MPDRMLCPDPLNCSTIYGELTIDGWSLHTGAWCAWDLSTLFDDDTPRGDNVLVETEAGRIARPLLGDQRDLDLPMMFSGAVDRTGTVWANPAGGLSANRRAFRGHMIDPIRTGTATLAATLTVADPDDPNEDVVLEADVQPLTLRWTLLPGGYARAILRLRIPAGVFVEASP